MREKTTHHAGFLAVVLIVVALMVGGCAGQQPLLRMQIGPDGEVNTIKRVAKYSSVNYLQRWSSKAYKLRRSPLYPSRISEDQQNFLAEHGQPEYLRFPFRTQYNELAEEWVYTDTNLIVQFVDGHTVYVGPLTDVEQVLMQRGYPDYAVNVKEEVSDWYQCFYYRNLLGTRTVMYTFHRGKLLSQTE